MIKKLIYRVLVLAVALGCLLLTGCSLLERLPFFGGSDDEISQDEEILPEEDPEYPVSIGGADLSTRPGKVVSLAPSLTEKLYDLNMEDRLVGVSEYCDVPPQTGRLPSCGTMLLPDMEVIADLAPHLVLTETQLPEDALIALQQMNVEVAVLSHAGSLSQLYEVYESMAILLEGQTTGGEIGAAFTQRFQQELDAISAAVRPYMEGGEAVPVLYLRMLDFTVATGDTMEHELIEAAGMRNVAADGQKWEFSSTQAQSESGRAEFMAVQAIFCDEDYVTIRMLEQSDFYKGLPAVLQDWYLYIDATIFERQSLRMLDLLREMADYCYPEAGLVTEEPAPPDDDGDTGDDGEEEGSQESASPADGEDEG